MAHNFFKVAMFSLKKILLLACINGNVSTNFIEIDTSDAQVV